MTNLNLIIFTYVTSIELTMLKEELSLEEILMDTRATDSKQFNNQNIEMESRGNISKTNNHHFDWENILKKINIPPAPPITSVKYWEEVIKENNMELLIWLHNKTNDKFQFQKNDIDTEIDKDLIKTNIKNITNATKTRLEEEEKIKTQMKKDEEEKEKEEKEEETENKEDEIKKINPQSIYNSYPQLCAIAAENGHMDILQWLRRHNFEWDGSTCEAAAKNGKLEVLKWARANGCHLDNNTCNVAATNGHLDVLIWAISNGCKLDKTICAFAALGGHMSVLQWARENDCPWDKYTCIGAANKGHFALLKWAIENGCPVSKNHMLLQQDSVTWKCWNG